MKFIKTKKLVTTKTGASLLSARGVGAVSGIAAFAFVVMSPSTGIVQVSVLLLASAALLKASAVSAEGGTRALVPACVRVGRPAGSALRQAGGQSACTHQGQGDTVSPRRHSIIPLLRVGR